MLAALFYICDAGNGYLNVNFDNVIHLFIFSCLYNIKEMYQLGARRIGVFNAPPMGCVPFQRTMAGGIIRTCVQQYNDAAVYFNNKLSIGIDTFKQNFPSSRIAYMDVYNPLLDIIVNNQKYGNSNFHFVLSFILILTQSYKNERFV